MIYFWNIDLLFLDCHAEPLAILAMTDMDYKAKGGYKFNGIKELYVVVSANKMRIMVER